VAAFRDGGPRTGGGRSRRVLVGAEVALALVLLVGAGMMVNGFRRTVRSVEVADPDAVLTMTTALPEPKYAAAAVVDFYDRVADGLRSLPDVRVVAVASNTPLNNAPNPSIELTLEGRPALAPGDRRFADLVVVSPEYFAALGVPLLAGRLFANGDGPSAPPVAILSAQAARRYWPDEDPVGKRLKTSATGDWITIAGVVADVRQSWFDREIRPQIYLPARQAPRPSMTFLLRTSSDPLPLAAAARARVHEVDRDQPVEEVRTLARLFTDEMSPLGFATVLMTVFGVVALALSAIGVYGVMAYAVAQRTHEIGVRMALGARRRDVLRLVVGQSLGTAAIGIAVGLPLAVALTRVMSGALFGVVAFEPVVLVGLVVLLLVTAVAATYVPTRRAVRVDPMIALRRE
jgi:putative ABC transport system permease protein